MSYSLCFAIRPRAKAFCDSLFGAEQYAAFVYGSHAYGLATEESDLDILILAHLVNARRIARLTRWVLALHTAYGLPIDSEVPHRRKLLASWYDADRAIAGDGFRSKSGCFAIKPISKTPAVLSSEWLRLRLLLNALTGKCAFIGGDRRALAKLQASARISWVRLLSLLLRRESFTLQSFVGGLIGTGHLKGEMFLGFKDNPVIRSWLEDAFSVTFANCLGKGLLCRRGQRYVVNEANWTMPLEQSNRPSHRACMH